MRGEAEGAAEVTRAGGAESGRLGVVGSGDQDGAIERVAGILDAGMVDPDADADVDGCVVDGDVACVCACNLCVCGVGLIADGGGL